MSTLHACKHCWPIRCCTAGLPAVAIWPSCPGPISLFSRITWSTGNAVRAAALDARRQILQIVADRWGERPEDLDIKDGVVFSYRTEEEQPLKGMVVYGLPNENFEGWTGGPIVGQGHFMPTYVTNLDFETGQGPRAVVHYTRDRGPEDRQRL